MTTKQMDQNDADDNAERDRLAATCHAFSRSGQRCEATAGHEGKHAILIEWSDDECWDPSMSLIPPTVVHIGRDSVQSIPMGVADGHLPIPEYPVPPFMADPDDIARQVAAAEAKWEAREMSVDTEALAELDFGRPADAPALADNRCVACDHQHAGGKCRCGCETFIPRLT